MYASLGCWQGAASLAKAEEIPPLLPLFRQDFVNKCTYLSFQDFL